MLVVNKDRVFTQCSLQKNVHYTNTCTPTNDSGIVRKKTAKKIYRFTLPSAWASAMVIHPSRTGPSLLPAPSRHHTDMKKNTLCHRKARRLNRA